MQPRTAEMVCSIWTQCTHNILVIEDSVFVYLCLYAWLAEGMLGNTLQELRMVKPSLTDFFFLKGKKGKRRKRGKKEEKKGKKRKFVAENGFDPSTSGLWAQHASTAPLC